MNKFLINASNLHTGGGVQVAASFIAKVIFLKKNKKNIFFLLSKEVYEALIELSKKNKISINYKIIKSQRFYLPFFKTNNYFNNFKSVFTIFGPFYFWNIPCKKIVGFAQPWIIYPENECYAMLSVFERVKTRLKYWIQGLFFKSSDVIIVELESIKKKLISTLGIQSTRIHVIRNCVSSIYFNKSKWQSLNVPIFKGFLRIGYLGANYFHKNTAIFYEIAKKLKNLYGIKVFFYVTFTEKEWGRCTQELKDVCINLGPLQITQCPSFYKVMDAMILPSLLECFSIMPFETMVMKKPLFVSDRSFNREICGSHAHYFDPLSPESAAKIIYKVFTGSCSKTKALGLARKHAMKFSNDKERTERYFALLTKNKKNINYT
jgi:glycosyltransferase involved in cell wall biosynthesis